MTADSFSSDGLVVVTGASSGIGRATVLLLNAAGARVVGIARNEAALSGITASCTHPHRFDYFVADLSNNPADCSGLVASIVKKQGRISGFVHAAGVLTPQPLSVLDIDDITNDFNTNLFSALFLTKAIASKKNRQEILSIVYVSSITAKIGNPGALTYSMTKASLNSLVVSLAQEIGGKNLRINAVMPGGCDTQMAHAYNDMVSYDYLEKVKAKNVFHEVMQPENVADLIAFLLSNKAQWIQGQCLTIDGGETLS